MGYARIEEMADLDIQGIGKVIQKEQVIKFTLGCVSNVKFPAEG